MLTLSKHLTDGEKKKSKTQLESIKMWSFFFGCKIVKNNAVLKFYSKGPTYLSGSL